MTCSEPVGFAAESTNNSEISKMMSNKLPSVLQAKNPVDSLSMERTLRQIQKLLMEHISEDSDDITDMLNASLDDIDTMLAAIDRN